MCFVAVAAGTRDRAHPSGAPLPSVGRPKAAEEQLDQNTQ